MNPYRLMRRTAGKILRTIPWVRRQMSISCDYEVIDAAEARRRQARGWHRAATVTRQDRAYQTLLDAMHAGDARIDLKIAAEAVDQLGLAAPSLLEIGCGSGYYSEILATLAKSKVAYSGVDYSAAAVKRARLRYPGGRFSAGDATALVFADSAFDIAFNGVSLMHILDYEKAINEAARVAARAVIFHSTPVFTTHPTTHLYKYAYGAPVVEIVFNRNELIGCFDRARLRLVKSWHTIDYDVSAVTGAPSHAETFLCEKMS